MKYALGERMEPDEPLVSVAKKHKASNCHLRLLPLYLTVLSCIAILSQENLQGISYLFALSGVIIAAFVFFTKSIQERFLWLIAFIPLEHLFSKQVSGVFISPFDVVCGLLFMEIVLKHRYFIFPRKKECFFAIGIFLAILLSSMLSPLPGILQGANMGIIIRAFVILFLFFFSIKIFNSYVELLQMLRALSSLMITCFLIYLLLFLPRKDVSVTDFIIGMIFMMAISLPCAFLFARVRRLAVIILIISLVLVLLSQCRSAYLILFIDLLCLALFSLRRLRPIKLLLIIVLAAALIIPIAKHFRYSINQALAKSNSQERLLALISGFQTFNQYPLFGIGYGNSARRAELIPVDERIVYFGADDSKIALTSHNTLLRVAGELGLAGLIPFLLLVFYYFNALFIKRYKIGLNVVRALLVNNTMNLLEFILRILFVNMLIYLLFWDVFSSPWLFILFMIFSVWIKVKEYYEKQYLCEPIVKVA